MGHEDRVRALAEPERDDQQLAFKGTQFGQCQVETDQSRYRFPRSVPGAGEDEGDGRAEDAHATH
jgi:hypothetical protein